MSLRSRVDHLQRLSEDVRREPLPCGTCGAPAGLTFLFLTWEEGLCNTPDASHPCAECGADPPGSRRVVPDSSSGAPGPGLVLLNHDGDPDWTLLEWLERHAGRSFGTALDAYFARRRTEAAKRAE